MPKFYTRDGKPVEAYGEEAQKAYQAGEIGLAKGTVTVIDPEGKEHLVPTETAHEALQLGFRFQTAGEYNARTYGDQNLRTVVEGIARTATGGISDYIQSGMGIEGGSEKDIAGREDANPIAATIGEVGGAFTGVGGLITKAGVAAGKATTRAITGSVARSGTQQAMGRLAGSTVGAGVEGGLWGVTEAISEEALGDAELNGQRLLMGAFAGGTTGAGLGLFGRGLQLTGSKVMSTFGGKAMQEKLRTTAEQSLIRQLTERTDLKNGKLDDAPIIARYGLDKITVSAKDDAASFGAKAAEHTKQWGDELGAVAADMDSAAQAAMKEEERVAGKGGFNIANVLKHTKGLEEDLRRNVTQSGPYSALRKLTRRMEEFLPPAKPPPPASVDGVVTSSVPDVAFTYGKLPKAVAEDAVKRGRYADQATFSDALQWASDLKDLIGYGQPLNHKAEQIEKLRDVLKKEIIDQGNALQGGLGDRYKTALRNYRSSRVLKDLSEKTHLKFEGNMRNGLTDRAMWAAGAGASMMTGNPAMVLLGIAGGEVNKLSRERGGFFAAAVADRLSKTGTLPRMAKQFKKLVNNRLTDPTAFGAYRGLIERAAAEGEMELLNTHVTLAQAAPDYLTAGGFKDESPEELNAHAARADGLEVVAAQIAAQEKQTDVAVARALGQQSGAAPKRRSRADLRGDFAKRMKELELVRADPSAMPDPGEAGAYAPNTVGTFALKRAQAAQFLYEKAPKNPDPNPIKGLQRPWEPSDVDIARWFRYADAVENPLGVVASIRTGSVTPEAVEAVQAIYPKLVQDAANRMMERIAVSGKSVSYAQKLAMSQLLGVPVGGAGDPKRMSTLQQLEQAATEQQQPPKRSGSGSSASQSNFATMGQLLEQRNNQT